MRNDVEHLRALIQGMRVAYGRGDNAMDFARNQLADTVGISNLLTATSIDQLRKNNPVDKLCKLLDVAKSGYQSHAAGKVTAPRKLEDLRLEAHIKAAHTRGRGIYGAGKIQTEFASHGIAEGINRIKRLRKLHDIRCIHKKKFKVTTDSKHHLPIALNVLDRQFDQTNRPNQVWVVDITYIPTDEGWLKRGTTLGWGMLG